MASEEGRRSESGRRKPGNRMSSDDRPAERDAGAPVRRPDAGRQAIHAFRKPEINLPASDFRRPAFADLVAIAPLSHPIPFRTRS